MDADTPVSRPTISNLGPEGILLECWALGRATSPASFAWPVANRALYTPIALRGPAVVRRLWWANGSAVGGNADCGIYADNGVRIVSTGSTAVSGTTTIQSVSVTPLLLPAGRYYLALVMDNTTATRVAQAIPTTPGPAGAASIGMCQQDSAFPLPATMTPITVLAVERAPALCGFTSRTVI